MKPVAILICLVIGLLLLGVFLFAWITDLRMEHFRANLKTGQVVTYFRRYYSRTEDNSDYGRGIIYSIDHDEVVVIKSDMSKIRFARHELYPA